MLAPMAVLVCLCLTVAVIPRTVAGSFSGVLDQVLGRGAGPLFLELGSRRPRSTPSATSMPGR